MDKKAHIISHFFIAAHHIAMLPKFSPNKFRAEGPLGVSRGAKPPLGCPDPILGAVIRLLG